MYNGCHIYLDLCKNMHVFMSSTINLVFGMFVLSINAKKYKYIYSRRFRGRFAS